MRYRITVRHQNGRITQAEESRACGGLGTVFAAYRRTPAGGYKWDHYADHVCGCTRSGEQIAAEKVPAPFKRILDAETVEAVLGLIRKKALLPHKIQFQPTIKTR